MITITSIRNIDYTQFDEIWGIVQSMKPNAHIRQVIDLAPSKNLFYKYLDLKKQGNWNQTTFDTIYVPQFISEIAHNYNAITLLNQLIQDSTSKNIALVCFCPEESLCHRSIIAGILQGAGASVKTDSGTNYAKFWSMLMQEIQSIETAKTTPKPTAEPLVSFRGDYYFLSNMFPCQIRMKHDGIPYVFSCVESAFQAAKDFSRIQDFVPLNGFQAKKLGRHVNLRPDWESQKLSIMQLLVETKFKQHPELMEKLKVIQGDIVEQNTWGDTFWGVCNGVGENHLGKILMQIRDANQ